MENQREKLEMKWKLGLYRDYIGILLIVKICMGPCRIVNIHHAFREFCYAQGLYP